MTEKELIDYCLSLPMAYEDYPFDDATPVMRHQANKKMFALIARREERLYINLKCEPMQADFLRSVYKSVTPGFHMNKTHWNSVYMDGDVPKPELLRMIDESYELIGPKSRRRNAAPQWKEEQHESGQRK